MYLIDESYFTGVLEIPNINELDSKVYSQLNSLIDEKVRLLLLDALGLDNFKVLDSYIVNGVLSGSAPQIWKDLVNGKEYSNDSKNYRWNGLIYQMGSSKLSLLAFYVYYYWLENQVSFLSGVGEVRAESKNAFSVNSTQRLTNVWNSFVRAYQGNFCNNVFDEVYFYSPLTYFIEWNWCDYRYNSNDVSLIQYLSDNYSDYPDIRTKTFRIKNQLGL